MKCIAIILFSLLLSVKSFGQVKSAKYYLTIQFLPAFLDKSELIINSNPDSTFLNLKISKNPNGDKVFLKPNELNTLTNFLKTYKFQIKNSIDTIRVDKNGGVEVEAGMDGITVYGTLAQNDKERKFQFWFRRRNIQNYKLMSILFDLLDKSKMNEESKKYIKELKTYF